MSLAYAREKIKARRKTSQKKNVSHDTLDIVNEPLQFVEFWGDEHNPIDEDEFTEGIIFSEDGDIDETEENRYSDQVYSDDQTHSSILSTVQNIKQGTHLLLFYISSLNYKFGHYNLLLILDYNNY